MSSYDAWKLATPPEYEEQGPDEYGDGYDDGFKHGYKSAIRDAEITVASLVMISDRATVDRAIAAIRELRKTQP